MYSGSDLPGGGPNVYMNYLSLHVLLFANELRLLSSTLSS